MSGDHSDFGHGERSPVCPDGQTDLAVTKQGPVVEIAFVLFTDGLQWQSSWTVLGLHLVQAGPV